MELRDYLSVLRRYWRSITTVVLLGVLLGAAVSLLSTPTYTSKVSLFFSVRSAGTTSELNSGASFAEGQVTSFAKVVTTDIVLDPVIDDLALDTTVAKLAQDISVTVPASTATMDIAVTQGTPEQAFQVASAVATELIEAVDTLSPPLPDGTKPVVATVVKNPQVPTSPTTPKTSVNLALGLLLGLLIGAGQALLRDQLNLTVRTDRDIARVTDAAILGRVPIGEANEQPLVLHGDPHSLRAEAYRGLRTNLLFLGLDQGHRAMVVTSSVPSEGKTTNAINIATTLAAAGDRVLLIDADLRKPKVAKFLSIEGSVGLTTVLIGEAELDDVIQPVGTRNLSVLASGPTPPNPAELLGMNRMRTLIADVSRRFDTVIIDAPPLLAVTDAAVLSQVTDGVLVVVGSGDVKRPELSNALAALDQVDARVLGLLLGKVRARDAAAYGYKYSYGYTSDPHHQPAAPVAKAPKASRAARGQ